MTEKAKISVTANEIALVREFNRFYTRQIGVLQEDLLSSPYSLTEVRVMYELSWRSGTTASELASILGFDHGYMSRLFRRLQALRLIGKRRSSDDGRQRLLTLTSKGRRTYSALDLRASSEIQLLLKDLSAEEVRRLLAAMDTIRRLLSPKVAKSSPRRTSSRKTRRG
jgi:DNA-binding MarR family transcriptional regulator